MKTFNLHISRFINDIKPFFSKNDRNFETWLNRTAFNWHVRAALYRHLSVQIDNNINQVTALENFIRRLERQRRKSCVIVVKDIIRMMKNGAQISSALRLWVPIDESFTISGAESAGNITIAFELLLQSKARETNVRRAMVTAFTTPLVYLCAIYGMLWAIGMFFLPSIEKVMPTSKVHGLGSILYGFGAFATSFWMILPLVIIIGLITWIFWALPNWTSIYRVKFEEYFPFNFYRDIKGYVWLITFASMLRAGMSDTKILLDQSRMASPWLQQRLLAARRRMINGEGLAKSLQNTGYYFPNPDILDDIDSMVDFDDFPDRITKRTAQWADDLENDVKSRIRILGFCFDMVMYGIILIVLLGMNSLSIQMGSMPGFG